MGDGSDALHRPVSVFTRFVEEVGGRGSKRGVLEG